MLFFYDRERGLLAEGAQFMMMSIDYNIQEVKSHFFALILIMMMSILCIIMIMMISIHFDIQEVTNQN